MAGCAACATAGANMAILELTQLESARARCALASARRDGVLVRDMRVWRVGRTAAARVVGGAGCSVPAREYAYFRVGANDARGWCRKYKTV